MRRQRRLEEQRTNRGMEGEPQRGPLEASSSLLLQKPGRGLEMDSNHREVLCPSGAMVARHHRLGCLKKIVQSCDSGAKVRDQSVGRVVWAEGGTGRGWYGLGRGWHGQRVAWAEGDVGRG